MIKNKSSEDNLEIPLFINLERNIKKITFLRVSRLSLNLMIVLSIFCSPWLAQVDQIKVNAQPETVTYNSAFSNGVCTNLTQQLTLSGADLDDFKQGKGVFISGVGFVYGSTTLHDCCYDNILSRFDGRQNTNTIDPSPAGLAAANCSNVPFQQAGNGNPWYVSDDGNFQTGFGAFPVKSPLDTTSELGPNGSIVGSYSTTEINTRIAEYLFATAQDLGTYPVFDSQQQMWPWSYRGMDVMGIENIAAFPPQSSNFSRWFEYLTRLVTVNLRDNDDSLAGSSDNLQTVPTNGSLSVSGNISDWLVPQGNTNLTSAFYVEGNLTINNGFCNAKRLVFVDGDLTISPNFVIDTFQDDNKGCFFIVNGDTKILPGDSAQNGTADYLHIGIYTNGETILEYDDRLLIMNGSLSGVGLNIQRSNGNFDRDNPPGDIEPSLNLVYDPRYTELFSRELRITNFSTRERGFNEGI